MTDNLPRPATDLQPDPAQTAEPATMNREGALAGLQGIAGIAAGLGAPVAEEEPDDPADEHPGWCDPDCCEVAGGRTGMFHRSAPVDVDRPDYGPVTTAQRARNAYEPAGDFVVLRIVDTDRHTGVVESAATYWYPLRAALRLSMTVGGLCGTGDGSAAVFVTAPDDEPDEHELEIGEGARLLFGGPGLSGPGPVGGAS